MENQKPDAAVEQNAPEAEGAKTSRISRGHLILLLIGLGAFAFFCFLMLWISFGAKVEEKKSAAKDRIIAPTEKPRFSGDICTITLPEYTTRSEDPQTVNPKLVLVRVAKGAFTMGDASGRRNEKPCSVALDEDFYIGRTEVTQDQWRTVMGIKDNGNDDGKKKNSYFRGDDLPVDMVSWKEAMAFCDKLNKSGFAPAGWMFTLPTEAQWEFAARGGVKSRGCKYSGSDNIDEVAWHFGNNANNPDKKKLPDRDLNRPVAQKKPNELGLYDMTGNVWEWCLDRYESAPRPTAPRVADSSNVVYRSIRGGSWYTKKGILLREYDDKGKRSGERKIDGCRVAVRSQASPDTSALYIGFRVALVKKPAK